MTARKGGRFRAEACVGPYDPRTGKIPKKCLGHFNSAEKAARAVALYRRDKQKQKKTEELVEGEAEGVMDEEEEVKRKKRRKKDDDREDGEGRGKGKRGKGKGGGQRGGAEVVLV